MKKDPIFIVGLHRSGVNFLGNLLSPQQTLQMIHAEYLESLIYDEVLNKKREHNKLIQDMYDAMYDANHKRIIHPCYFNLWRVLLLQRQFPRAKFACLIRDPFSGIQSMMKQEITQTILSEKNWENYPIPNEFLGIVLSVVDSTLIGGKPYKEFTLAEKCALRWAVHAKKISKLVKSQPTSFIPVVFEKLIFNNNENMKKRYIKRISNYLELTELFDIKEEMLNKSVMDTKFNFTEDERRQMIKIILDYFKVEGGVNETLFPIRHYFAPDNNRFDLTTADVTGS